MTRTIKTNKLNIKNHIDDIKDYNINFDNVPTDDVERQYYFLDKLSEIITKKNNENNKKYRYCVVTFGCQMNFRDSEKLAGILQAAGMEKADEENADIVIYNTCTIRENADQKLVGHLGRMKNLKGKRRDLLVAICGCMMQDKKQVEFIKEKYGFIDLIFGTHNLYKFAELLYKLILNYDKIIDIEKDSPKIVENLPVLRKNFFKSGVNISFGCDNFCTYCIVPYVRGAEKSRKSIDIINEIEKLSDDGVIEVMLLGQNVNSYGKGLKEDITFTDLLKKVEKIEKIKRIRFMTSNPHDLSDELIDLMGSSKKLCSHFHLPLQSGSDKILKLMNRRYDRQRYIDRAMRLRKIVPDIAITTDIMVGFPGESDADFEDTLSMVEMIGFDNAFTFIYSKRNGTPAANMENQVDEEIIKKRFNRLLSVVRKNAAVRLQKNVGLVLPVLAEGVNSHDSEYLSGRLSNNTIVHFKADKELIGNIVNVKLNVSKGFYYLGELIND